MDQTRRRGGEAAGLSPQGREWEHRGAAGAAAPARCRGEAHAVLPQSHPQLPLLVEIGIKPCLGIVLGDRRKGGLSQGSRPGPRRLGTARGVSQQPGCSKLIPRVGGARHTFTLKVPSLLTPDGLALPIRTGLPSTHAARPRAPVLFTLSAADADWQT